MSNCPLSDERIKEIVDGVHCSECSDCIAVLRVIATEAAEAQRKKDARVCERLLEDNAARTIGVSDSYRSACNDCADAIQAGKVGE